jgi:hypothetical protein
MMETKHTPTPWQMWPEYGNGYWIAGPKGDAGPRVAHVPNYSENDNHANAAFIVRACNSHEAFKKWASDRIAWLEKERRSGGDYNHLTTRLEECQYILTQFEALAQVAP